MEKNRITKTLIALLLIAGNSAVAQKTNEFTVKQTVDYGLKNSVQVKNALLDIKAQKQTNREFTANAYPQLTAGLGVTHYFDIPVQAIPNFISPATYQVLVDEGVKNGSGNTITMPNGGDFGVIAAQFGTPWTANGGFDVSQILFDGQVFVGLQARGAAMSLATKNAEVTQEQIKANIYKIYYQLAVGKQQLASIDDNIATFNKLMSDTREIYKNGFVEKLDVDKVQVSLNNLTSEREKVQNALDAGNAALKFLINMPQKEILVLTDSVTEDEIKADLLDTAYKYEDRKEIQALGFAAKLNEFNVKRFQLSRLPSLVAFGTYSRNAQRQKFDFFDKGDWYKTALVGVKMSIPIFDGFARRARIENAKISLEKINNTTEAAKQMVDYDVANAKIKMKSALLTLDIQKRNIDLAQKVYNTTKKKYEQGLGSNQEISLAQTEFRLAQANYYGSLYDAISAKIDWLKAIGKL
ncbi:TolC family protein [Ferruginibacter sp. SUN002]|uniref:TolC family protein n=1 Tax=Ferruginibacter sp. SUN002 TaxID=2937789 RepID=UPI003D368668